jgi:hypothetical protein
VQSVGRNKTSTKINHAFDSRGIEAHKILPILAQAPEWVRKLRSSAQAAALTTLVARFEIKRSGFKLMLRLPTAPKNSSDTLTPEKFVPLTMKRRGVELRLVIQNEPLSRSKVDLVLLKTIARAHQWFDQTGLRRGQVVNRYRHSRRPQLPFRREGSQLAFLAPEIVEAIAEGRQPPELSTELLIKRLRLPLDWADQKRLLNIG